MKTSEHGRFARMARERAEGRWGHGWKLLGNEQKTAAVSHDVLMIVLGWVEPDRITARDVQQITRLALDGYMEIGNEDDAETKS